MIQLKIKTSAILMVIMLLLTSMAAAAEKVSTVDAKELFAAKNFITDEPETVSKDITEQMMDNVSANMAKQRAMLHWDAVNNSAKMDNIDSETTEKATPIIITAADIDAKKKAQKQSKQEINSIPDNSLGQVKVLVLPKKETVLPAVNKVNSSKADSAGNYTEAAVSLPPIQSVKQENEKVVALPPIEDVAAEKVVALPPVQKIS